MLLCLTKWKYYLISIEHLRTHSCWILFSCLEVGKVFTWYIQSHFRQYLYLLTIQYSSFSFLSPGIFSGNVNKKILDSKFDQVIQVRATWFVSWNRFSFSFWREAWQCRAESTFTSTEVASETNQTERNSTN